VPVTTPLACHGAVTPSCYTSTRMEFEANRRRSDTFVIHVAVNDVGELAGVVHHVRTGEKRRFERLDDLSAVIRGMTSDGRSGLGPEHR
jgi:hypothetical protein